MIGRPRLLVAGPPCGGKSTYAESQVRQDEKLLDFDKLAGRYIEDESTRQVVRAVFNSSIPQSDIVVWTAPLRSQRLSFRQQFGSKVVVVVASIEVCKGRAHAERPEEWKEAIDRWFNQYEPFPDDEVVVTG